jgi:hypothetical protein
VLVIVTVFPPRALIGTDSENAFDDAARNAFSNAARPRFLWSLIDKPQFLADYRADDLLSLAKIKSTFKFNRIRRGCVTCYMDNTQTVRRFGEGQLDFPAVGCMRLYDVPAVFALITRPCARAEKEKSSPSKKFGTKSLITVCRSPQPVPAKGSPGGSSADLSPNATQESAGHMSGGLMLTEQLSAMRRVNPLGQWQRGSAQ